MAILPHSEEALDEERKVRVYLLSSTHRTGRYKAAFFLGLGFDERRWMELRNALLRHAREGRVAEEIGTQFGRKFIVEGPLAGLNGKHAAVRTVWFVSKGTSNPRLVTAYPGSRT